MKPRSLFACVLCALGFAAGGAAIAGAQDLTRDRVQYALDLTDHRIEQAQMALASSTSAPAQLELNAAVSVQAQAQNEFGADHLLMAMRLTLSARAHADRAIAIVRGLPDPDRVRAQIERTREILDRARDRIEECDNNRARAMLRTAFEMQTRAERAAEEGRFLAALQLSMSARERGLRALRLCNMEENLQESAERAIRRTDELIARAQDKVVESANEQAREVLGRARQMQDRANDEFRSSHFEASLRLTEAARAAAYRAIRMSTGSL
jgi:hypothetical protein